MLRVYSYIFIFVFVFFLIGNSQVSSTGCYISGALIDPGSTAGCGNSGTNNYCNLASLYVPIFSPLACGTSTSSGGVNHTKVTVYTLPAGCTATVDAEFRKRNYLGVGATATGCGNCGMDAGAPDALYITQSGGVVSSQSSTIDVNVAPCGSYPVLGVYTTATASLSAGCSNADGYVQMILTGGTFTIGGASNRADEIITFTVNMSGTCGPLCSAVLPIELLSFYGESDSRQVNLIWKVAMEKNVDYYLIEKSPDGLNWETISRIPSSNKNYATNLHYKTIDHYPVNGVNYYRLTNVDNDDSKGVSSVIAVNHQYDSNSYWPEQNDDEIIIHFKDSDKNISFALMDNAGKIVWSESNSHGSNQLIIPKSQIARGMFILSSHSGDKLSYSKLIIH